MNYSNDLGSISPTGLTVLVQPDEPKLDIVFVHGFTGHPMRTWSQKNGYMRGRIEATEDCNERSSKFRKLNPFTNSRPSNGDNPTRSNFNDEPSESHSSLRSRPRTCTYWPIDLIPTIVPEARVLTYGYDTHIRHRLGPVGSQNTVYDIAWNFLIALEAKRRDFPLRPLIFIVHSLGGIVVKEMLRRSNGFHKSQTHLRAVFTSTIGIMFFGTPHGGANPGHLIRHIVETIIKASGFTFNERIIDTLLPSSDHLRQLRDEFVPMAVEENWVIHSFQEQNSVRGLGGDKVVEDVSSYLNQPTIEITEYIGRDHMEMCRFTGANDVEYAKVASALKRMIDSITTLTVSPKQERLELSEEQITRLTNSLAFDQIDARLLTIKRAHAKTCKWLLNTPQYLTWLDDTQLNQHHGFLWIKGKPGAGKSTLMEFALTRHRKSKKDKIISFFFNARGEDLEKSTLGTYRSLLLQILDHFPELRSSIFDCLGLSASSFNIDRQWTIESLELLLEQAIMSFKGSPVVCFIDALDECDEIQIRDMVSFLERIGERSIEAGIKFRVCFSSRYYPHITIRRSVDLDLEEQEGHDQDIANYLDSELKLGRAKAAPQIRQEVQEKSSGIFMWVVLVVRILNKEHDSGRPPHKLRKKLEKIPRDLDELFQSIITRDSFNKEELILCLQWVLFARQPLKPEQLYFAILSELESDALPWDRDEVGMEDIQRFVLNASKGLAEVTKSRSPTVQFIHETVKSFLLREHGLGRIWAEFETNFAGQSHERLKLCCLNHLSTSKFIMDISKRKSSILILKHRDECLNALPFLEYSVRNVLYHADIAERLGTPQERFLKEFPLSDWVELNNLIERHNIRKYTESVSLLYVLAEYDLPNLIKVHWEPVPSYLLAGDERYGPPLLASLATGSKAATRAFLEVHALAAPLGSQLYELCRRYCQENNDDDIQEGLGRQFKFSKTRNVLSYLVELGYEALFNFVLETDILTSDEIDELGQTPLFCAIGRHRQNMAKLLIDKGKFDLSYTDNDGQTLFDVAVSSGNDEIVSIFLDIGDFNILFRSSSDSLIPGSNVLIEAVEKRHESTVKLLLGSGGFDLTSPSFPMLAQELIHKAKNTGQLGIIKLLLDACKLDADIYTFLANNLLDSAISLDNCAMAELSLRAGQFDDDSTIHIVEKAFRWSVERGHTSVVELLLERTPVDIDTIDPSGYTPLIWAAKRGHCAIVKLLLDTGRVSVNAANEQERLALHWAVASKSWTTVRLLLNINGVEIDCKDNEGRTPLHMAVLYDDEAIVQLLLAKPNVDVNAQAKHCRTPLHLAAMYARISLVKLILETGKVNVNAEDDAKQTALDIASQHDGSVRDVMVELLKKYGGRANTVMP